MGNNDFFPIVYRVLEIVVLIVSGIIFYSDYVPMISNIESIGIRVLLVIFLGAFLVQFFKAFRLHKILNDQKISKFRFASLYGKTAAVSMLFPYKLGEIYKFFCYGVETKEYSKTLILLLFDRFIDSIGLLFVFFSYCLFTNNFEYALMYGLTVFIIGLFVLFCVYPIVLHKLERDVDTKFEKKYLKSLYTLKCFEDAYCKIQSVGLFNTLKFVGLSVLAWTTECLVFLFVSGELGSYISFNAYLLPNVTGLGNVQIRLFTFVCVVVLAITGILFSLFDVHKKRNEENKDLQTRFFNNITENNGVVIKSSNDVEKIKAEYFFYYLLPDSMKRWFVQPFEYQEMNGKAMYKMQHIHAPNIATLWINKRISVISMVDILHKYFKFFSERPVYSADGNFGKRKKLYLDKVKERIEKFKNTLLYSKLKPVFELEEELDVDNMLQRYLLLKERIEKKFLCNEVLVISHGDPCFSNALYYLEDKKIIFIDPKGAISENELWLDSYYDIAKLSHSICGNYDFINNDKFEIEMTDEFEYKLNIPFDNYQYKKMFRQFLEHNGYNYLLVRIYEVSLFLSMLPLHIDNGRKVLAFIINAKNILKEIEENA